MITKQRATGRALSIPAGIGLGVLAGVGVTLVGAGFLAWLMAQERLQSEGVGYAIIVVLLVASSLGALVAAGKIKRLRVQMCLLSGAVYYLVLLMITALFFGGKYQGMGVTAMVVLIGCGAASLTSLSNRKSTKTKIRKMGYR